MGVMGVMATSNNITMVVMALGFAAYKAEEAINEHAQENPHDVKDSRGFQNIKDGRPQFGDGSIIVNDGIDVETYGYDEANEQREQLFAEATGREVEIGH